MAAETAVPFPVHTGAENSGEIERISAHDITPEEFAQKYIKRCQRASVCAHAFARDAGALTRLSGAGRGMPVVVTGAMDAWPAFQEGGRKWSIDWFAQTYGHVKPGTGIDTAGVKEYMSLGEYLAKFDQYAQVCVCVRAHPNAWCVRPATAATIPTHS